MAEVPKAWEVFFYWLVTYGVYPCITWVVQTELAKRARPFAASRYRGARAVTLLSLVALTIAFAMDDLYLGLAPGTFYSFGFVTLGVACLVIIDARRVNRQVPGRSWLPF